MARFFIPICTTRIGRYVLVRQVTDTRTAHIGRYHQNRPSAVDFGRRRSIEGEIDHCRLIEGEKGKKKKQRKRRKKKKRRRRIPRAVPAREPSPPAGCSRAAAHGLLASRRPWVAHKSSSLARHRRQWVARGRFFSRAGRKIEV
ncbi:hypothetical protein BHE74_00046378, partial [Ensete ventricosum]